MQDFASSSAGTTTTSGHNEQLERGDALFAVARGVLQRQATTSTTQPSQLPATPTISFSLSNVAPPCTHNTPLPVADDLMVMAMAASATTSPPARDREPMNLSPRSLHSPRTHDSPEYVVEQRLQAMRMEDTHHLPSICRGNTFTPLRTPLSPHHSLPNTILSLDYNREQLTHTPPLPSPWVVQSLPLSHHDSDTIPAIDVTRVDAHGTLNKPIPLEIDFSNVGGGGSGGRGAASPIVLSEYASMSTSRSSSPLPAGIWSPLSFSTPASNQQPQHTPDVILRATSPMPLPVSMVPSGEHWRASAMTPIHLPPRPHTVSPLPSHTYTYSSRDNRSPSPPAPHLHSFRPDTPPVFSGSSAFRPIHKPQPLRSSSHALRHTPPAASSPAAPPPPLSKKRPSHVLHLSEPPAATRLRTSSESDVPVRKKACKKCNCKNSKCLKL
eukprot:TRINITY_DN3822_c0_g1_i7.p1 TRINITY_DN3822_c0_g1~~TRINITY_DN3822_c0_g1_i7.p1  ORF type:complete len:440 (-),score=39.99 TRINITY_DN3822_c0_g1_i7:1006-2325(-)